MSKSIRLEIPDDMTLEEVASRFCGNCVARPVSIMKNGDVVRRIVVTHVRPVVVPFPGPVAPGPEAA